MSIHIITLRVISQALKWANTPSILRASYSPKIIHSPAYTAMQEVTLRFDRFAMHQWLRLTPYADAFPRTDGFLHALQECFCNDIQVVKACYPEHSSEIHITLLLVVAQA